MLRGDRPGMLHSGRNRHDSLSSGVVFEFAFPTDSRNGVLRVATCDGSYDPDESSDEHEFVAGTLRHHGPCSSRGQDFIVIKK
jgi:hypothetical protein